MGMFLKQSLVLVAIAVLLVEANSSNVRLSKLSRRHSGSDHHSSHDHDDDNHDSNQCHCGHYKEVMDKVKVLLKAYGSKELLPDLQALGSKTVEYFLTYLAKEKPNELNKVHGFLQSTTKVTGNFVETSAA